MYPIDEKQFDIGDGVRRAGLVRPYVRQPLDPTVRSLQIYSTDPSDSKLDGTRTTVSIPYEPLEPGPKGCLFEVIGLSHESMMTYSPLDLEDPKILVQGGLHPSPTDAHFQMQMTYAVAMSTYNAFRKALGRSLHWQFETPEDEPARLKIYPFYMNKANAFYDRDEKAVQFGWYISERKKGKGFDGKVQPYNRRNGKVFTSLSHDIIAHEISHSLLDGMRPHFLKPFHRDTLALHEGFADLVAVFQHFSHRDLLQIAIRRSKGKVQSSRLLTDIATQFGQTQTNPGRSLRTAVNPLECDEDDCKIDPSLNYDPNQPIHKQGSVLVSCIFDAFATVFQRKSSKYIKIATGGTGLLPEGELEENLVDMLAKKASELAKQFLSICIRAIDYCPPAAVTFGDYLRAMITADHDLVPSDPFGYREALISEFIRRGIPIDGVDTLSESSLLWEGKHVQVDEELMQQILREKEMGSMIVLDPVGKYIERAKRVGEYLVRSGAYQQLGLIDPTASLPAGFDSVSIPFIESARISRRIGPDGQLETDLVAEITQRVDLKIQGKQFPAIQGCTVIIDSQGKIRYVISKNVDECVQTMRDKPSDLMSFWNAQAGVWHESKSLVAQIHGNPS